MASSTTIASYLAPVCALLRQHLSKVDRKQEVELLHELRVAVKKLRALWLLHPHSDAMAFGECFPSLRNVFRIAGAPRDSQVAQQVLGALPAWPYCPGIRHRLIADERKAARQMKAALLRKSLQQKAISETADYEKLLRTLTTAVAHRRIQRTIPLLRQIPDSRDAHALHDVRKRVKALKYQTDALPAKQFENFADLLEPVQQALGNWHDHWMALDWLRRLHKAQNGAERDLLLQQVSLLERNSRTNALQLLERLRDRLQRRAGS